MFSTSIILPLIDTGFLISAFFPWNSTSALAIYPERLPPSNINTESPAEFMIFLGVYIRRLI